MPLQNRVQPDGSIIAFAARGHLMGNRGILHDAQQRLGRARWRHKAWVTCLLSFKGRHRAVMQQGQYTELFFLDEAVAFAAGHRPCGECRRGDYLRFRDAAGIVTRIADYDKRLHADRVIARTTRHRRHECEIADLPDGTFVSGPDETPMLVRGDALLPYTPKGYGAPLTRPLTGQVSVLTPLLLVQAMRDGYEVWSAAEL